MQELPASKIEVRIQERKQQKVPVAIEPPQLMQMAFCSR